MSTIHRVGIHFSIRTDRVDKNGNYAIYVLLTHNGEKMRMSINHSVAKKKWNASNQKVIGTDSIAKGINNSIDITRAKIIDAVNILSIQQKPVSLDLIRLILTDNGEATHQKTLLQAAEKHNAEMKSLLGIKYAQGNFKNYKSTHKFLLRYIKEELNGRDIPLTDLSLPFAKQFETWLLLKTTSNHNGAMKHIQRVKKIINWSIQMGWLETNPIAGYKVTFDRHERGFLSEADIATLETAKLDGALEIHRLIFLFQIYTGLAFSDVTTLTWEHLQLNGTASNWIVKPREKTNVTSTIPLIPKAMAILEQYGISKGSTGKVFKVGVNQSYNRYLKQMAARLGIKKRLTTHIARHTFATTITLSNGIPMETVSRMLGHTKISTTQIYSKVTVDKIARDMDKLMSK